MATFVVNCGSSSIKCALYRSSLKLAWEARLQWKNQFKEPALFIKNTNGAEHFIEIREKSSAETLHFMMQFLTSGPTAAIGSLDEVSIIGHRVVHGGPSFRGSVLITSEVTEGIRRFSAFAPHNEASLEGIHVMQGLFGKKPQLAVFDTTFHQSIPQFARTYPLPRKWRETGIERYGFHGLSFQYCKDRTFAMFGKSAKMVICHLGSGASLSAVKEGKSIDTTMGFTPLEGLMMDSRSGSIDPGILLYLLTSQQSTVKDLTTELYHKSGLLGISGTSSDMRDILRAHEEGDQAAILALDMYVHRLNSCIGSMISSLQGIDTIVFTGGIGEHTPYLRQQVCDHFAFLGMHLDRMKNEQISSEDRILSTIDSPIRVVLVHTREELVIAQECEKWKK